MSPSSPTQVHSGKKYCSKLLSLDENRFEKVLQQTILSEMQTSFTVGKYTVRTE